MSTYSGKEKGIAFINLIKALGYSSADPDLYPYECLDEGKPNSFSADYHGFVNVKTPDYSNPIRMPVAMAVKFI